ncbi:MAG: exopolysaccharide biosynthesis protein [Alphaproteobacteria bacterium]|nr:exopolysaccharide biosynthesis protein [Alphaproteobacteria bacterium]
MSKTIRPISQVLFDLRESVPKDKVCTFDLLQALHERGFGFLLFIFALPAAIPLPGLGVNLIIAAPLVFLTAQQALGRHTIWIPEKIKYKSINRATFEGMLDAAMPYLVKIEYLIRPRLGFMTQGVFGNIIGIAGLVMALSVCIPLPLTNTVPSMGIALMAIGVIMRDGLAVLAGMILGLVWVAMITYVLIFIGTEGLDLVKETIKSLL